MAEEVAEKTFWDHLDDLRSSIVMIILSLIVATLAAFVFKDEVFQVLLAPKYKDFVTYTFFNKIFGGAFSDFSVDLISTGLSQQFMMHLKASFAVGILCASPYIIYVLFRFVSPALYADERRNATIVVLAAYIMFLAGVLFNYFIIFPFTFQFLGTYQVSGEVANMITLQSYLSTLIMLSLMMGVMCEMPVLAWILGKLGVISASSMKKFRRHSIVVILIVSAVVTPTTDVFTLSLVSVPIYILYEASVLIVSRVNK